MKKFTIEQINNIPKKSGIYKIKNKKNNKIYIGSAFDLHSRIYNHCFYLRKNQHHNPHLQSAWNKYEETDFEFIIIEFCDKKILLEREQIWLDHYRSYDNKIGYNICHNAGNSAGRKFSEETKEKIRQSKIGKKASEEAKKKMSISRTGELNNMYGKKHKKESIQKMKENRRSYIGNNNPFYGKQHSEETKSKLREKALNRQLVTNSKLNKEDVFQIKWELFKKPKKIMWKTLYETLAYKFNVSPKTILDIKSKRRWRNLEVNTYIDKNNKFIEMFNPDNGFYIRSGIINETGEDTGIDPFMRNFPSLIDIGIMKTCVCSKVCNVDCYQKAIENTGKNMSLEDFEIICKQSHKRTFSFALGGAGDVDTHENFEEILQMCRKYNIVPNFTTSGIAMTSEKAAICKKYCGAIAVSEHFSDYTEKAIDYLLAAGVKTNIHYVLSNKTIDLAIERLKNNSFRKGINAVIFLLYKPVGLGKEENILKVDDPRTKEFFDLVNKKNFHHKIGFDSCSCSGIVNFTDKINMNSIDYCEGGRFSAYIDADLNMMPCSFANQDSSWFMNLKEHTIEEVWNSELFDKFRYSLANSCSGCKDRLACGGGCPLVNQITLCNRKERSFAKQ